MTANRQASQEFLTGWRKGLLHLRVALHVVLHFGLAALDGRMPLRRYPAFLRRARLFLRAVRSNKVVRRGRLYKLHLYFPAYPSRAFFHALEKLHRPRPGPVTVVLSMTRACDYACPHCYQGRDGGADLPLERLLAAARAMQEAGVSLFDIEGGEPLLRCDRLAALLGALDDRAEAWINTTGAHLDEARLEELVAAGLKGVMVSVHRPDAAGHDAFTGRAGSLAKARAALRLCSERGLFTAINCCPDPEMIDGRGLEQVIAMGRELGCSFVQVIHNKAAGRRLGELDPVAGNPTRLERLRRLHRIHNRAGEGADQPALSVQVCEESRELFGCTAGGVDRFYLGAGGEVQPCEFLNISFGNVGEEDFETVYGRMRRAFPRPGCNWLCCTQAPFLARLIAERGRERTPLPWAVTRTFIDTWERGEETPLYRRLGIYR